MKKNFFITFLILAITLTLTHSVFAQGMMGFSGTQPDNSAIKAQQQEEQEGKKLLDELKNKTTTCQKLTDDNLEKIGEYFMGQAVGDTSRHIAMNTMMQSMMGEQREAQIHTAWGKRGSGCDTSAQIPSNGAGFMPMMFLLRQGFGGQGMMGWGFGILGWLFMLLFWLLIILGVVALIRYLARSGRSREDKTPLDMLKERYAKGEINKKEFEEKKKDLG
ncbi:MAG: hypothetical protein UV63_C0059G0012 [Microgenomates group bacterium GW2011_GWC1_43_11]|nr:MAG: hypothetical protein UV17_C0055G0008 [Candidatus Gottesmanbacteria bacterium GW2011_GWA1_42_26]KKS87260.1 MAG: hypothetical protein UV63_C0059G0012 [Microgenomates group bacterium GW2011_GWC1_43_11]HCM81932.1 hypothetical protein [Patescibacteria group bacterium]